MAVEIDERGLLKLFPEIDAISDRAIRQGVVNIWKRTGERCKWQRFEDVPKNLGSERDRRLTDHVRGVTRMAMALAEIAKELHGTPYNRDHLIAACLLHDVSKVLETDPDPKGKPANGPVLPGKKSEIGKALQHAAFATHDVLVEGLPLDIAHLVLTHTHDSGMRPRSIEASYLFYADYADSDAGILPTGETPFVARWEK
jgi:hypothetical protein